VILFFGLKEIQESCTYRPITEFQSKIQYTQIFFSLNRSLGETKYPAFMYFQCQRFVYFICFALCLFLWSCNESPQSLEPENRTFKIPVVIQEPTADTIEYFDMNFLVDSHFLFGGKYKFMDTMYLRYEEEKLEDFPDDYVWDRRGKKRMDSLNSDGFQLFADYNTSIYSRIRFDNKCSYYFPVYLVNETSNDKIFTGVGGQAYGIQEAIDTSLRRSGEWRPIEARHLYHGSFGYFELTVHPGEFVFLLVPKYNGDEIQPMRLRLEVGDMIYISRPYNGTFNPNQFDLHEYYLNFDWVENKDYSLIDQMFFGAMPREFDED
jgi:hypothetical protein